jgi:hypothetical protein
MEWISSLCKASSSLGRLFGRVLGFSGAAQEFRRISGIDPVDHIECLCARITILNRYELDSHGKACIGIWRKPRILDQGQPIGIHQLIRERLVVELSRKLRLDALALSADPVEELEGVIYRRVHDAVFVGLEIRAGLTWQNPISRGILIGEHVWGGAILTGTNRGYRDQQRENA